MVIVDDVITDGAAKRESINLIKDAGAVPAAVLIALDRMERAGPDDALSDRSAVQELERQHQLPVLSIASLDDLVAFVRSDAPAAAAVRPYMGALEAYRSRYGA